MDLLCRLSTASLPGATEERRHHLALGGGDDQGGHGERGLHSRGARRYLWQGQLETDAYVCSWSCSPVAKSESSMTPAPASRIGERVQRRQSMRMMSIASPCRPLHCWTKRVHNRCQCYAQMSQLHRNIRVRDCWLAHAMRPLKMLPGQPPGGSG